MIHFSAAGVHSFGVSFTHVLAVFLGYHMSSEIEIRKVRVIGKTKKFIA